MTNKARAPYVGVISNLERRLSQYKGKQIEGFTSRYGLNELTYYASTNVVREAIVRGKQIKAKTRAKKFALIEEMNPNWDDLSAAWYSNHKQSGLEVDSSLRSDVLDKS